MPEHTNACVSSWHSFCIPCQGKSNFLPWQQHFSNVPKSCPNHSVYHETPLKLSKQLSTSLQRQLLTDICFLTYRCSLYWNDPNSLHSWLLYKKKTKPVTDHVRWHVIQLRNAVVLTYCDQSVASCSQAQFHSIMHQFRCLSTTLGTRWYSTFCLSILCCFNVLQVYQ